MLHLITKIRDKENVIFSILYIILGVFLSLYIVYIKFLLPIEFISYENYHGISYLNWLIWENCKFSCYTWNEFIQNIFWFWPIHGYMPRFFYGFLFNITALEVSNIFAIQSLISICTYGIISIIFYFVSWWKKEFFFISFILLLTFPHQIKYWYSEGFYILWNFFISISVLFYILFLKKINIIFYFFSVLFFIFAIYTRNLYLLYIPIFILLSIHFFDMQNILKKIKYNIWKVILWFIVSCLLIFPIYNRLWVLLYSNNHFGWYFHFKFLEHLFSIIPYFIIFLFLIGLSGIIYFKNKVKWIYIIFLSYLWYLFYKYLSLSLWLERHTLMLEPLIFFVVTLWWYSLYYVCTKYISSRWLKKWIFLWAFIFIFSTPFLYKYEIHKLYSVHQEYLFIRNHIDYLNTNDLNLIFTDWKNKSSYDFPLFLLRQKNIDYTLYSINTWGTRNMLNFHMNYEQIRHNDNIFYFWTYCYIQDERGVIDIFRDDCQYMFDHYILEKIVDWDIGASSYIWPSINTHSDMINIWFYKVIWKK